MASRRLLCSIFLLSLGPLPGCSGTDDGSTTGTGTGDEMQPAPEGVLDERARPPAAAADEVDFVTPELTIEAGEERQYCSYMRSPTEDLYVEVVQQIQGNYGHHAILMTTRTPGSDGEWVDCTEASQMADYKLTLLPLDLPAGYAQRLPANQAMVLQSHYLNTTEQPLLVRDIVRLRTVTEAEVEVPTAPLATHNYEVDMGPLTTHEVTFDCEFDRDAELITVGGHMHEFGSAFTLEHGTADGNFETLYSVPEWTAEYRDSPPIDSFVSNPVPLAAGDVLRTTCAWNNTEDQPLAWPAEMCASFGLITGDFEPFECNLGYDTTGAGN